MEATKLSVYLENMYIPKVSPRVAEAVPEYHPCLIVQDSQTDVTKLKACGCADAYCVKNAPKWIPKEGY